MRITKQGSGSDAVSGRGEYEIAEDAPGGITPADLFDRAIRLTLGSHEIRTDTWLKSAQGKRRLRIMPPTGGKIHAPRQVAAVLMMPKPVRDERTMEAGIPVLQSERYIMRDVHLGRVALVGADEVVASVQRLEYGNQARLAEEMDVVRRMRDVEAVWAGRVLLPVSLSDLVARHEALTVAGGPISTEAERVVHDIQEQLAEQAFDLGVFYHVTTDPVPPLLQVIGEVETGPPTGDPPVDIVGITPEDVELRRREVNKWRQWARRRGAASVKFARDVRAAYRHTCMVCGLCLPPTEFSWTGIDAAHILPWNVYDLDRVDNGMALCKVHHWAFDQGLLVVECDEATGRYEVIVPAHITTGLAGTVFTLSALLDVAGVVDNARLPTKVAERPNPQFLRELQATLHPLDDDA